MGTSPEAYVLVLLCLFLSSGHGIQALSYDYYATTECLKEPQRAQYGGGIIANPEFTNGIEGWSVFGKGAIKGGVSEDGNRYIIAHTRTHSLDSFSQKVQFEEGKIYSFSAWVQVKNGSENVVVVFRRASGELIPGGRVTAMDGCWSFLKGGIVANFSSGPADILFKSNNTDLEIWVDSVSLQPFTMEQWRSHQDQSIHKERKRKVKFQLSHPNKTMEGAIVSIKQTRPSFPFGCAMNNVIINNKNYQNWFASRFKYTTFVNEMKWYSTENVQGRENYADADAMLKFAEANGIHVRGHNIFWDDPKYQMDWVKNLSPDQLRVAAAKRIRSVVSRYKGKLIAWDVMNENLHFSFFEDKLGKDASAVYFALARQLDPGTTLFMNEYNTIEESGDGTANPANYIRKFKEILSYRGNDGVSAAIGLEGHFGPNQPNLAYMRASLDTLASTGWPIWLTEVDVKGSPNQAWHLEQVLREGHSHPGVKGIIMWALPAAAGPADTTLADINFKNTPSGDVVDKLLNEWKFKTTEIKADSEGSFEVSLFHGDYDITIKDQFTNSSTYLNYKLTEHDIRDTLQVHVNAF